MYMLSIGTILLELKFLNVGEITTNKDFYERFRKFYFYLIFLFMQMQNARKMIYFFGNVSYKKR